MANKPVCNLKGVDGNIFAVIGHVSKTLRKAGQSDKAVELQTAAFAAGSYHEALALISDYVDITWGGKK